VATNLLYISFFAIIAMGIYVLRINKKQSTHWVFLANIASVFLWASSLILDNIASTYYGKNVMLFTYMTYLGLTFYPITLWITGSALKNGHVKWHIKYLLACIIPIVTNIMLWTNQYHHMFYQVFHSLKTGENMYGAYFFYIHVPYFYFLNLLWVWNMVIYALKNGGILIKQVVLVVIGTVVFLVVNISFTFGLLELFSSAYASVIAFAFMMLCYLIAIVKYQFLNIVPIAKEKIIDNIIDCIVVLDKNFAVQNMNTPFKKTFCKIFPIKLTENFIEALATNNYIKVYPEYFKQALQKSIEGEPLLPLAIHVVNDDFNKWFSVTITCIDRNMNIGSIVTFRDITYEKQYEVIATERAKLRGFVQIAGDMAHDINTPLSTARNCICEINNILNSKESTAEKVIQKLDYLKQMARIGTEDCERTLKIANKLKNQTCNIFNEERKEFDLKILIESVLRDEIELEILKRELNCKCFIEGNTDIRIQGYPSNLGKVIKNLIKNAIESYRGKNIDNKVVKIILAEENELVIIAVKDYGAGIKYNLQKDIFEKPLKIKNLKTDGGGLSLFFAQIIVTGQLEGKIWFESTEGVGTTFFVSIPLKCRKRKKESLLE